MTKNFWLGLAFLSLSSFHSSGCDVCGCSSMGFGIGDWANQGRSLISTNYSLRHFEGPNNDDYFHQLQLNAIWALDERWQLKLSIPWIYAQRSISESGESKTLNELSDISLALQYRLWSKIGQTSLHNLYLSFGLQAPTGHFQNRPSESLFAPNFQAGSASWDLQFSLQYEYAWRNYLLVFQSAQALNTSNTYGYRFGNQFLQSLKLAKRFDHSDKASSLLFMSLDHEYLGRDVNQRGYYQYGSGGQAFFSGLGAQYTKQTWSFGLQYQFRLLPAQGEYQARDQFNLNFSYFL